MTQKNITWKGVANDTTEYCVIKWFNEKITVTSTVEGMAEGKKVHLEYELLLDKEWQVKGFQLQGRVDKRACHYQYTNNGAGHWYDDQQLLQFEGCRDLDISLTPLTNTLPIKRLKWKEGETRSITVLYVDVLNDELRIAKQSYTQLSDLVFKFENDEGGFKAELEIDQTGFVLIYPGLYEMSRSF